MTEDAEDEVDWGLSELTSDEEHGNNGGIFSGISEEIAIQGRKIGMQGQMMRKLAENMLAPIRQQMSELVEALTEYREEIREAIESTIDLEEPWDYDQADSEIHDRAERTAVNQLFGLVGALDEVDDPTLKRVQDRMVIGYQAYGGLVPDEDGEFVAVRPRIHETIFVFISL